RRRDAAGADGVQRGADGVLRHRHVEELNGGETRVEPRLQALNGEESAEGRVGHENSHHCDKPGPHQGAALRGGPKSCKCEMILRDCQTRAESASWDLWVA